jgi:AcrR family transcriptional regulator
MDAAQILFLQKGFELTSVAEIVKIAGLAKGTFYLYFEMKEDVLLALQKRFIQRFCQTLDLAFSKSAEAPWLTRLDEWVAAGISVYLANVEFHDLVFHNFPWSRSQLQKANPVVSRLAHLLEVGVAAGAFDIEDSKLTAVMLFSAMHGAVDEIVRSTAKNNHDQLILSVSKLCQLAVMKRHEPAYIAT